jgi:taurine dioxygenase
MIAFSPLKPFGIEVLRDLNNPLTAADEDSFRALFDRYGLILARGQKLSMERQRALCGVIGPILDRPGEAGTMSNETGGPSASALGWHSDAAYTENPFDALSLHALDVVDRASSTRFVHAGEACDSLPPHLLAALEGCEQEMIAVHYTMLAQRTCDQRNPEALKRGILPAIYTSPRSQRRCIWTSELQTVRLLGMAWEDSRAVLHQIFEHLYAEPRVFEHRWCTGDFILWDNVALQHSRGDLNDVGNRVLQRAIVGVAGVAPHIQVA